MTKNNQRSVLFSISLSYAAKDLFHKIAKLVDKSHRQVLICVVCVCACSVRVVCACVMCACVCVVCVCAVCMCNISLYVFVKIFFSKCILYK